MQNSLSVPHTYAIGSLLKKGKHSHYHRVDNRQKTSMWAKTHIASPEQTPRQLEGIVRKNRTLHHSPPYIEDLQVYPDVKNNKKHPCQGTYYRSRFRRNNH